MLTSEQREELENFCKTEVHSVKLVKRERIILELDTVVGRKATKQEEIEIRIVVSRQTVNKAKKDYLATESISAFL